MTYKGSGANVFPILKKIENNVLETKSIVGQNKFANKRQYWGTQKALEKNLLKRTVNLRYQIMKSALR